MVCIQKTFKARRTTVVIAVDLPAAVAATAAGHHARQHGNMNLYLFAAAATGSSTFSTLVEATVVMYVDASILNGANDNQ